jgi:hypothetical protein
MLGAPTWARRTRFSARKHSMASLCRRPIQLTTSTIRNCSGPSAPSRPTVAEEHFRQHH